MNPGVLIVGGSPAGLQAALDLADAGVEILLAEISPFIADNSATNPPQYISNTRALEVFKHPRIHLLTQADLKSVERIRNTFKVQLLMHPRHVDLNRCTACGDCLDVCPVTVSGNDHTAIYLRDGVQPQCAVIDKMGQAPCSQACPAGIHAQGYVALIAQGRFREALDLVREAMPFPGICGRICNHLCELNCRRNEVDEPVAIRQLKRFIADWELKRTKNAQVKDAKTPSTPVDAKKVAIIGAGPAGLTAAYFLALKNHCVTVYERLPVAGGMMAVGIPAYRLPRNILNAEIRAIQAAGVKIKTGVSFGKDLNLETLLSDGCSAVFLATGLHSSRQLGVAGENLDGVLDGVSFLRDVALGKKVRVAKKLIVVGGGNVAIDVALTARRLGSEAVTIVCLESQDEMPARKYEINEALQAGVEIVNCFGPNRFIEKNGRFGGIEFKRCTCVFDDQCNFNPQYDENELYTLAAKAVIIAIGQRAELDYAASEHIKLSDHGGIQVDAVTLQTSIPWVFAGGDAIYGPQSVVEAIASGKQAAESIDRYLNQRDLKEGRIGPTPDKTRAIRDKNVKSLNGQTQNMDQMSVSQRPLTAEQRVVKPRIPMPALDVGEQLSSFCEVELGYSQEQAMAEAQRCLACGPCSECMACVQACKAGAIVHQAREKHVEFEMGTIILADDPRKYSQLTLQEGNGIYRVSPQKTLSGSVAAAHSMHLALSSRRMGMPAVRSEAYGRSPVRIGVFICQCGGQIDPVVDTDGLRNQLAALPGVNHVAVISQACLPEAAESFGHAVINHGLNQLVLAACACCSLDQVCFSCSYQRVRCKDNFGLFTPGAQAPPFAFERLLAENFSNVILEFVNIREQCAWVHAADPEAATAKAAALIASAVAKLKVWSPRPLQPLNADRSVLILGDGEAVSIFQELLKGNNIALKVSAHLPQQIWRADGQYVVSHKKNIQQATALVLAPRDTTDAAILRSAFWAADRPTRLKTASSSVETQLPGVFFCDPLEAADTGAAAAVKVAGWLGQMAEPTKSIAAAVDPHRCRACKTCIQICELGAPQLVGEEPRRHSWIDPMICTQCGTCGAHCPSGAITAGYATDEQLEAMLAAVLKKDDSKAQQKVVVYTCNWSAYWGLDVAGRNHISYSPAVYPVKVMCLGRLGVGIILKTFDLGADGVLLLGCPPNECHYEFGNRRAEETFDLTRILMRLLGHSDKRLVMDWVAADHAESWSEKIETFVAGLNRGRAHHG